MEVLVAMLETFEGMHKKLPSGLIGPYICPAGYPTQGLGLLVKSMDVPPITEEEAYRRCLAALPYYITQTLKLCPTLKNTHEDVLFAITDFTYNLGAGRLKVSTLRRKLLDEDYDSACIELRKWVRGGGRVLPGLVKRREAEILLIKNALNLD